MRHTGQDGRSFRALDAALHACRHVAWKVCWQGRARQAAPQPKPSSGKGVHASRQIAQLSRCAGPIVAVKYRPLRKLGLDDPTSWTGDGTVLLLMDPTSCPLGPVAVAYRYGKVAHLMLRQPHVALLVAELLTLMCNSPSNETEAGGPVDRTRRNEGGPKLDVFSLLTRY